MSSASVFLLNILLTNPMKNILSILKNVDFLFINETIYENILLNDSSFDELKF